ncbi:hypothetical protein [Clostridium estertheticum]|uniref:hypothetical protein n=1 Tax=Clostridium estertheticum TaxID=238834 RepID=UPI001C0C1DF5|nr:hypothetical protein [Clostridium estertheticum]MBU3186568.1 hypothetical protein [Clostridium estertheticum]
MDSLRLVEIFINDGNELVEFKYNCRTWYKFSQGVEIMKGEGFSYKDFLDQVLHQYPLLSVKSFKLNDISELLPL